MRVMAWGVAALVAATGCSGSGASTQAVQADEHAGPDAGCTECKVTGGGVFLLKNDQRVTFGLNAIPTDGTGSGGVGSAAEGHIEIQLHDPDDGTNIFGDVDTVVSCARSDHDLFGTFQGKLRDGGRFEVTVKDAGEPGRADTITYSDDKSFGPVALVQGGNLQIHGLDQCQPPSPVCPEGQCIRPDTGQCEPCDTQVQPPPFIPQ